VKVGDLVKVTNQTCGPAGPQDCGCWFCWNDSSGIGVIVTRLNGEDLQHSGGYWAVLFDAGEWRLYGIEMNILSALV